MINRNSIVLLTVGCFLAQTARAQDLISAQSGLIHYTEGDVFVDATPSQRKPGEYPNVKAGRRFEPPKVGPRSCSRRAFSFGWPRTRKSR